MYTTLNASDLGILDRLTAVNLDVTIWSARKKMKPQDLPGADLPPDELASLGTKKVCDPQKLAIFSTLKGRAVGVLGRRGVRFLGGWVIPEEQAAKVEKALEKIERDFEDAKEAFLATYEQDVQNWVRQYPEWTEILQNSLESIDYVRSRIGFRAHFYGITLPPATGEVGASLCESLKEEVAGFSHTLFSDIAKDATRIWEESFQGKEKVSHKALSPLRDMRDKLRSFAFVEPHVEPVAALIDTALNMASPRGYITGATLIMLQGIVSLLRDPHTLIPHAAQVIAGRAAQDVLAGLFVPQPQDETLTETISSGEESLPPGVEQGRLWPLSMPINQGAALNPGAGVPVSGASTCPNTEDAPTETSIFDSRKGKEESLPPPVIPSQKQESSPAVPFIVGGNGLGAFLKGFI